MCWNFKTIRQNCEDFFTCQANKWNAILSTMLKNELTQKQIWLHIWNQRKLFATFGLTPADYKKPYRNSDKMARKRSCIEYSTMLTTSPSDYSWDFTEGFRRRKGAKSPCTMQRCQKSDQKALFRDLHRSAKNARQGPEWTNSESKSLHWSS